MELIVVPAWDSRRAGLFMRRLEGNGSTNSKGDVIVTDFAAASNGRGFRGLLAASVIGMLSAGLAGCETGGGFLDAAAPPLAQPPAAVAAQPPQALAAVAVMPVVGAPDGVGKQIIGQLAQSAQRNRFTVVSDAGAKADFTLRGYFVASRDRAGAKVSYIWDLNDPQGQRVNRITGEEIAAGTPNAKNPWATVSPGVIQVIADKTAAAMGAWLPSHTKGPAATPPAAPAPAQPAPGPVAAAPTPPPAVTPVSARTTAALPQADQIAVVVPAVVGAPGDGNGSLSGALQRELTRQGVTLMDRPGASYRVEGKVTLGAAKDGKQPIQIDWRVRDPQGKSLGTVSQKNEIPPGSLDGQWGKTADAAAGAAAQGILKLLPQRKATN